ncbi:hypothetical protein GCM10009105_11980 [Dokdonella soli]|uniref:DUF4124 domain-containing protein n=2 Tax=Dokdonella soli TaxID=529810 RepID=A0ABN1IED7_9GAMM
MRCSSPRVSLPHLLAALLAAGSAGGTLAASELDHNRFKWHDAGGNLHYSDALPPEAAKLGYEVVSPQGIVIKRVERAKTAEELAASKAELAKAKAERDQVDEHARADARMLSGYPTEADLKRSQQQKLEMLNQQIVAAQISLRSQEQTLADLLGRAADAERANKALPDPEARQLAAMRKQVDDQRLAVERRQYERDTALSQFEGETTRYRELKAKLVEPHQQ